MVLPGGEPSDWSGAVGEPSGEEGGPSDGTDSSRHAPTVLSLAYGCGRLAAALYEPLSMTASLLRDTPDPPPRFAQLRALLGQVQPDQVITSARQDERLLSALSELVSADARADDQTPLQLQPSADFRADSCRHRVLAVQLPAETSSDEQAHYNFITSRVDFTATTMIRAFGGLLRYLDRRPLETLTRQPVMRIETLALEDAMYVSSGAFRTLQVFSTDRHPSSFKAETTREGLSVFGVLNKCCSPLGVAQLRRMLMQPLTSRARIEARLDAVEFFSRPANEDVMTSLQTCVRRVRNLTPLLHRMRHARALSGDWRALYDALHGAVAAAEVARDLPPGVPLFARLAAAECGTAQQLLHTLHRTVNLAETRELRRFTVNLGLDSALDAHKRAYAALPELLSDEMAAEQSSLPEEVQTCSMVFLPQVGFLIMVDEWRRPLTREQQRALPGLRFQFEDRGRVLFKSERCDALDESVGDVATAIRDRETQVMVRLSALVLDAAEEIHQLCDLCGELDATIALARAAAEFGYVRPRFVDEDVLELRGSRHPLLELCSDLVVPNDYHSGGGGERRHRDRVKLVTGANGGGKSVYVRQVALAVLMAQAGSFVAAGSARLGVQRALLTVAPPALCGTAGDAAAGGGGGSAFLAELRQLCAALGESGSRALLVVDEFGGGTLAEDGAALLAAALTQLLARRDTCPHVLVSTHVHRLASLLPPSQLVTPVCPQLVVEPDARAVTFLYQMVTGTAGRSHALAAAAAACLPDSLIDRAEQVTSALVSGSALAPDRELLRVEESSVERARRAVETFLRADLDTEDPAELLRRVREECRSSEDVWEDSVIGGAQAPDSERLIVSGLSGDRSSVVTPVGRTLGASAAGLASGGPCRQVEDSSDETPVIRLPRGGGGGGGGGGVDRPPPPSGQAGWTSSSSTALRGSAEDSSSLCAPDADSAIAAATAAARGTARTVPGARYSAVYNSSSSEDRTGHTLAGEGPLTHRGLREQFSKSSTWSEDPERRTDHSETGERPLSDRRGPREQSSTWSEDPERHPARSETGEGPLSNHRPREQFYKSSTWSEDPARPTAHSGARERRMSDHRPREQSSTWSEDPERRTVHSGAAERPLNDRRAREESSTWSEDPERRQAGPPSRMEGHTTGTAAMSSNARPRVTGILRRSSTSWSSDQPTVSGRPAPASGPGGRGSSISEDPLGRRGSGLPTRPGSEARSTTAHESTERLFAHSRISHTPGSRTDPGSGGGCGGERVIPIQRDGEPSVACPGESSSSDITTGVSDWSLATSRRGRTGIFDSGPLPPAQSRDYGGGGGGRGGCGGGGGGGGCENPETTPTERRAHGGYFYSHMRCETVISSSSALGVSERSALVAEVTEGSLRVTERSAASGRTDWWLSGRPLKRPRTGNGGAERDPRREEHPGAGKEHPLTSENT